MLSEHFSCRQGGKHVSVVSGEQYETTAGVKSNSYFLYMQEDNVNKQLSLDI